MTASTNCWTKLPNFLHKAGEEKYLTDSHLDEAIEEEWAFIYPVAEGVATREEVETATLKGLQLLNGLASRKTEVRAKALAYELAKALSDDDI